MLLLLQIGLVNCVCVHQNQSTVFVIISHFHKMPMLTNLVEEACPAVLHHSGFSCGNHQKTLVGDFRKRTLS